LRRQPMGRGAGCPLGVARLDREYAERLVARHQRRSEHARRLCLRRTEPGSGWHGLPRRLKPERPKEVAKIVDLLGAGEKVPQHHGAPGSEGANLWSACLRLGTAVLRGGANQCIQELFLNLMLPLTVSS